MHPAFFEALVGSAGSEAECQLWEGVLRECFAAMAGLDFASPEKHAGAVRRWGRPGERALNSAAGGWRRACACWQLAAAPQHSDWCVGALQGLCR